MAYATLQDLVAAFGPRELTQLSTADGADMVGVDATRVLPVLDQVSGFMDSYLRRRYAVPVPITPEIRACCLDLARFRLAHTGSGNPTEQVAGAKKSAVAWLESIARGDATLDGAAPAGLLSGARVQDRSPSILGRGLH